MERSTESVRAVDRALDILLAFRPGDSSLAVSELLKRVDLSRPTLYRLLRTLEQRGFVVGLGQPQRFYLGPSVAHLAQVWGSGVNLAELAQPVMHRLWEDTGETVALLLQRGAERICVAELPSPQPLSFRRGIGHSEGVTVGASGRVILAFVANPRDYLKDQVPEAQVEPYLERLARIREEGYAVSRDELIRGAVAVAAPVLTSGAQVLGSLAVYGPSVRVDDAQVRRFAGLLRDAARELSARVSPA